jgi:Ca-activated chloride channel family protein
MHAMPTTPNHADHLSPQGATSPALPLERASLRVDARAGLARVIFEQRFVNRASVPLRITYKLPLPADAAVSGFAFTIGDKRSVGVVDTKNKARERFEQAIVEGRTAALLEQDRTSLFTQELGNVPPGEAVTVEVELDQPLSWLAEGAWEWRFPLAAAPRYLGEDQGADGHVRSGATRVDGDPTFETSIGGTGARATLSLAVRDALVSGRSPESPSHPLSCVASGAGFAVELGSGNAVPLDRDVVVRWPVAKSEPSLSIDVARPKSGAAVGTAQGRLVIVPPSPTAKTAKVARDLVLLLDTSGSMDGEPLRQLQRLASAMVDALGEVDTIDVLEFSSRTTRFGKQAERATPAHKKAAIAWIHGLSAGGGTEMTSGVREAIRSLRADAQKQVVLVTDGLVGFEREVVSLLLRELPASSRMHAVGVGESANRSLLMPAARAGRGVEVVVGLGEDAERAAARLLAHTHAPVVVDVTIEGSAVRRVAPERMRDLYAGAPVEVALELDPRGGEILVRGRGASGAYAERLTIAPIAEGEGSSAVSKRYARERVEDLEMQLWGGESQARIDAEIERIGLDHQIATKQTSWVAVSDEVTVDPRRASQSVEQPHELPHGMSAEGLGLRQAFMPMAEGAAVDGYARTRAGVMPPGAMEAAMAHMARLGGAPGFGAPTGAPTPPPSPGAPMRKRAMAPAAKVKGGLFELAKEKIASLFEREEERASEPAPSAEASGARRRLVARLVRLGEGRLALRLRVDALGLELGYAGATVQITLDDGSTIEGRLVVDESAYEASYAPGAELRLVVEHAELGGRRISELLLSLPEASCEVVAT